jgi:hypothetical protein
MMVHNGIYVFTHAFHRDANLSLFLINSVFHFTVTNMTIARQRSGIHVPKVTQSTVEVPPLLGGESLGTCPP